MSVIDIPRIAEAGLGFEYWAGRLGGIISKSKDVADYLRPIQREAREAIGATLTKAVRKLLVDMPTSSGKTALFIRLMQMLGEGGTIPRVIIVTPYINLVKQTRDEFLKFGEQYPDGHPLKNVGIYYKDEKDLSKPITVTTYASFQRLVRAGKINQSNNDIIILDEAHQSLTELRQEALGKFDKSLIFAFTATPAYNEDKTLKKEFVTAYELSVEQAIEKKAISPFKSTFLFYDGVSLDDVPVMGDEYRLSELQKVVNTAERNARVVEFYRSWRDPETGQPAFGQTGYVNCSGITHAIDMADVLNKELSHLAPPGVQIAAALHSDLPPKKAGEKESEEEKLLRLHKEGKILLLTQIRKASVGQDNPRAALCINANPSLSPVEVTHRGGRVTRMDKNNPNKVATIVELIDKADPRKMPLLYGEVVGPGVGYKPHGPRSTHTGQSPEAGPIMSDQEAIKRFLTERIKTRIEAMKGVAFYSAYDGIVHACRQLGIKSTTQVWNRYCAAAKSMLTQGFINRRVFEGLTRPVAQSTFTTLITAGKGSASVSPWDIGKGAYTLKAMLVGVALGRHPRHLFGSPQELAAKLGRAGTKPTPQRTHIHALMQKAIHPVTRRRGLNNDDIRELASTPELKSSGLGRYLDDQSGNTVIWSFDPLTGEPREWALDLATILNKPVEEVFKYEAEQMRSRKLAGGGEGIREIDEAFLYMGKKLPLHEAEPLDAALDIPDKRQFEGLDDNLALRPTRQAVNMALSTVPARIERVLRLRFGLDDGEEKTWDEIGDRFSLTKSRISQIAEKGLRLLKPYDKYKGYNPGLAAAQEEYLQGIAERREKKRSSLLERKAKLAELEGTAGVTPRFLERRMKQLDEELSNLDKGEVMQNVTDPSYRKLRPLLGLD